MAFNSSVDHEGDNADYDTRSFRPESPPDIRRPNNCGRDEIPKDSINDHKKACPTQAEMVQCGARIVCNEVGNAFPISFWPCLTTVLVIVIAYFYHHTITDLSLNQARLLIKELQNNRTQNDEELTRAKSHIVWLKNDIKDLKVKETEHLENLIQSKLLVKHLQNEIKDLKAKEIEHLQNLQAQSKLLVKQLQNDIKDLKVKEIEHLENLTQSESLVKQLQNDIKDLKTKHSEELTKSANCKSGELTQTESKLDHLLSLLKSAYPYISKHDDEWPLKLFISDEMSDQVAPDAILKMSDFAKRKENKEQWYSKPFYAFQQGYQMCLKVYADGTDNSEGTHVSVYLYLMKGPHDDELEQWGYWPLSGTFTIEVLNQLNNSDHYSRIVTFTASTPSYFTNRVVDGIKGGWGHSQFISHDILLHHNNKYLKNDTLYFKISYQKVYPGGIVHAVLFILIIIILTMIYCRCKK